MVNPTIMPIYFGSAPLRSFGFLHLPAGPARRAGVILCDALGFESLSLHRTFRHAAERLAEMGFATLRFDYPGTGDSAGSDRDGERVRAWLDGIHAARAELIARTGVTEVALVGVRIGATLAAIAAAEQAPVSALVLWAPCSRGQAYVRERQVLSRTASADFPDTRGADVAGDPADVNAAGFVLTVATIAALSELDVTKITRCPAPRVLVMSREAAKSDATLVARLQDLGAAVSAMETTGYQEMMAEAHSTTVPTAALDSLTAWLGATFPLRDRTPPATLDVASLLELDATPDAPHRAVAGAPTTIQEEPIAFGPDQRLFGIVSRPAGNLVSGRPAVVLLNAGAVHRIAPDRFAVSIARSLAALGFLAMRFDLGGLGDSATGTGRDENVSYPDDATHDMEAAFSVLRQRFGAERFVLAGLCSGGHYAFHRAIRGAPVVGAVIINPLFYLDGGIADARSEYKAAGELLHYRQRLLRPDAWQKLGRGGVNVGRVIGLALHRAATVARARIAQTLIWLKLRSAPTAGLQSDLRAVVKNGVDSLLILGESEPSLAYLRTHGGGVEKELRGKGLRVELVPMTDHTFTPLWSQNALHDLVTKYVVETFGR